MTRTSTSGVASAETRARGVAPASEVATQTDPLFPFFQCRSVTSEDNASSNTSEEASGTEELLVDVWGMIVVPEHLALVVHRPMGPCGIMGGIPHGNRLPLMGSIPP